jgi:hypothetical protein
LYTVSESVLRGEISQMLTGSNKKTFFVSFGLKCQKASKAYLQHSTVWNKMIYI